MWQTGSVATYIDLANAVRNIATGNHTDSVAVSAAGTGYVVGDILTVSGGTSTWPTTLRVATLSGSGVATATVVNGGAYTVNPTNPASTTGGTGSGATFNLTMSASGWTAVRDTSPSGEKEIILQGIGSGSDAIFVGLKTYQQANGADTAYNWTLIGMTGFNSGLNFESQPGVSPGGIPTSAGGAYVPLKTTDAFPLVFSISVTGRRIWGVVKIENATTINYASFYLGFLNAFGTSTEFPYPIYVAGSTARHDCLFKTTSPSITGLVDMIGISGKTGPGYLRLPNGTWQQVKNSTAVDSGAPSRSASSSYVVYPAGPSDFSSTPVADQIVQQPSAAVFSWINFIPQTGVPGSAGQRLQPTNNTAGALRALIPATVTITNSPDFDVWGELDGIFWVSAAAGETNGDSIIQGGSAYFIYQNGVRTEIFSFMAVKQG